MVKKKSAPELDVQLIESLRSAGLKVTQQRLTVLREVALAKGPISHPELAEKLASENFDRVTVWRNLLSLTDAGLLDRTDVEHIWRFERVDRTAHGAHAHPHFVCVACKKVSCLPEDAVYLNPSARRGSVVLEVQLKGRCDDCVAG